MNKYRMCPKGIIAACLITVSMTVFVSWAGAQGEPGVTAQAGAINGVRFGDQPQTVTVTAAPGSSVTFDGTGSQYDTEDWNPPPVTHPKPKTMIGRGFPSPMLNNSSVSPGGWALNVGNNTYELRASPIGRGPMWISKIKVYDPLCFDSTSFPADFLASGELFDFFYGVGLTQATFTSRGSAGLATAYEDSGGYRSLLDITMDAGGVRVTGDPNVEFFKLDSLEMPAALLSGDMLSLSDISELLLDDVGNDFNLDTSLFLGVRLTNMSLPTVAMDDGSLFQIHVDISAVDAAVPEASTVYGGVAALVICAAGLWTRRGRKCPRALAGG